MKTKDIRDLSAEEIQERIREEERAIQNLRFQKAAATIDSPIVVRTKRRQLARLKTILKEKAAQTAS